MPAHRHQGAPPGGGGHRHLRRVKVSEVNPTTMASKLAPGVYFAGEVLDVDAYTGGFNLQLAWATGRAAGEAAALSRTENRGGSNP